MGLAHARYVPPVRRSHSSSRVVPSSPYAMSRHAPLVLVCSLHHEPLYALGLLPHAPQGKADADALERLCGREGQVVGGDGGANAMFHPATPGSGSSRRGSRAGHGGGAGAGAAGQGR